MKLNESADLCLSGRRLLIVEDEPLVAMDNAAELEAAGAVIIGPAASVAEALRLISANDIDAVVLDANLNGDPVDLVAEELASRKIPFVFVSGYGRANLPMRFAEVPLLGKPFRHDQLITAVAAILRPVI